MKAVQLGSMVVVLAMAAYPAYADDFAASIQDSIDTMTDLRNNYLAEKYFGESYHSQRTAAVETVNSAIELYEQTRADPHVQVTQRGSFVQHPTNPYGATVVAFEVINSMNADTEVYPFVVDVGTLTVLAEGAFPATVGLSAFFLEEADRPLEEIMEDLQDSDGTWVTYSFTDHNTGSQDDKRVWLSLHDGYIFGAGYFELADDVVGDTVSSMIRAYDTRGDDSLAGLPAGAGVSFVLDAGTLEIVAHTDPGWSGDDIRDAIDLNWPIESVSDILDRHGSLWLSYPAADEYVRAYLSLHNGLVFASGYQITSEMRVQSLVDEMVRLYDVDGTEIFDLVTSMEGTEQLIMTAHDNTFVAHSRVAALVGLSLGSIAYDQNEEVILSSLAETAGLWMDHPYIDTLSVEEERFSSWVVLHDGYLFSASERYSPEEATIETVNSAIELYREHGAKAFDRVTWQAAVPEIIYPFVVDAQTWELVAHGGIPERVGVCCAAPIAASNDLDAARQALEQNVGIWLEYAFYNPVSERYEHKRVWLSTYDGYTFAAGYYYGDVTAMQVVVDEAIALYDRHGVEAFGLIDSMMAAGLDYPFVLDAETLEIVAHGQNPELVGTNFRDKAAGAFLPLGRINTDLHEDGDTTVAYYSILDPYTRTFPPKNVLFQLHDGYIFAAGEALVVYTR